MTLRSACCAAVVVAIWIASSDVAHACSCFASGPPCQGYWKADAVFAGTVRGIEDIGSDGGGVRLGEQLVRFDVTAAFRNAAVGALEVMTGPGNCGYEFKLGRRYLVYAYKDRREHSERLLVSICSRTRPIEEAAEDLEYIASKPTGDGGARVFGRVTRVFRDPAEDLSVDYGPARNMLVVVRGETWTGETLTGRNGRYEVTGVPPGRYTVSVIPPPEFNPRYLQRDVEIADRRACSEVDFGVQDDASIGGTLVDSAGRRLSGVRIEAIAAEHAATPKEFLHPEAVTDESGVFEILDLVPGRWVVGVNLIRPPRADAPYPPTFYPGTLSWKEARVVEIAAGEVKQIGTFRLGAPLRERSLEGCTVWPDGAPAEALVSLRLSQSRREVGTAVRTNEAGCFSLRVHEGISYELLAWSSPPSDGTSRYGSGEVRLTVSGSVPPVQLVLTPR